MNTIQGTPGAFVFDEAVADAAIKPGMLLEYTSTGVKKHATEGGRWVGAVAVEDALRGKTVDDAYAQYDIVPINIQQRGAKFQGILFKGENVTKGAALISDGLGRLIAATSIGSGHDLNQVIGYAAEALDLSDSTAVDSFILVIAA